MGLFYFLSKLHIRFSWCIFNKKKNLFWRNTSRNDFKFYADRLIRLVIEESLNQLPYTECSVMTPTGAIYNGLKWVINNAYLSYPYLTSIVSLYIFISILFTKFKRYRSGNCGVSIVRSGEAMEQGLRDCCRSIRIGKILVESDAETHAAKVVYARFPDDISKRQVLLMYPIMSTGNTIIQVSNISTKKPNVYINWKLFIFKPKYSVFRLLTYLKSTECWRAPSYYLIYFVHPKLPKRLSLLFLPWKYWHLSWIQWLPIISVKNILEQIRSYDIWWFFFSKLCLMHEACVVWYQIVMGFSEYVLHFAGPEAPIRKSKKLYRHSLLFIIIYPCAFL